MIFKIAIYEDDQEFSHKIEKIIRTTFHYPTALNTTSRKKMLSYIEENTYPTMYILDIVGKNRQSVGIELAQKIVAKKREALIVFITNYVERLYPESFLKTRIFSFLHKNQPKLELGLIDTIRLAGDYFDKTCLYISDSYIPYKSIYYIETVSNAAYKLRIITKQGEYIVKSSLKAIMKLLDKRFVQSHKSYIINAANIKCLNRKDKELIFLDKSVKCPYSVLYRQSVIKTMAACCGNAVVGDNVC